MATAAQRLSDALIRHQITLERLRIGTARKLVALLRSADAGMIQELRDRLSTFGEQGTAAANRKAKSLKRLIDAILAQRAPVWQQVREVANQDLSDFARIENVFQTDTLNESVGVAEVAAPTLAAAHVLSVYRKTTIRGAKLNTALRDIEDREWSGIKNAVTLAVVENTPVEDFVKALRGTQAAGFKDGLLQPYRANLGTIAATGITSVSTNVRDAVWRESGIVVGEKWVSILDGRTSFICQDNDGHGAPFEGREDEWPSDIPLLDPIDQRPPAHYNCRSHMEAVLATESIVAPHRVAITSTIPDEQKPVHFRQLAKETAGADWSGMSQRARAAAVRDEQVKWSTENIGTVAPRTTYPEWLGRQSASFQDEVLGKSRGALFRDGGLEVGSFIDYAGKPITLDVLRAQHPDAFRRAGIA